ncbi:hypothetical protein [Nesterenkonia flava]|uniref:Uncharacterized protein n=1 Tax=Nesterenkonia flava TaxID=469799 RepID=A0ABU1FU83_9MICC|nr:hypothetical protein [Nesterenkonia flava]MDR5712221.1 hypothetical protein [Nesterenkonia flava]
MSTQNHDSTQNQDTAGRAGRYDFWRDPWAQGALNGALALIPARKYPRWLRRTLVWGPPVAGALGLGYLASNPELLRKLGERYADPQDASSAEPAEAEPSGPQASPEPPTGGDAGGEEQSQHEVARWKRGVIGAVPGAFLGTLVGATFAGGFWVDEKVDRALRRYHVPFPRVVMGYSSAALGWWLTHQMNVYEERQKVKEAAKPAS